MKFCEAVTIINTSPVSLVQESGKKSADLV